MLFSPNFGTLVLAPSFLQSGQAWMDNWVPIFHALWGCARPLGMHTPLQ